MFKTFKKVVNKKMEEGFTLIELVMVTIILGILAAVAMPKMTNVLNQATVRAELVTVDQIWAGCESYARNLKINLELGIPDEDNEWQFDLNTIGEPAIFHQRPDNEIYYYTYDSLTFELAEVGVLYNSN